MEKKEEPAKVEDELGLGLGETEPVVQEAATKEPEKVETASADQLTDDQIADELGL